MTSLLKSQVILTRQDKTVMAAQQYLVAVPAKATKSVDFTEKLPRFIGQNYDDEPGKFLEQIKELNGLREACVVKSPDKHETGLDLIVR